MIDRLLALLVMEVCLLSVIFPINVLALFVDIIKWKAGYKAVKATSELAQLKYLCPVPKEV